MKTSKVFRLLVTGCWLLVTGLLYASDSFKDAFEAEFRPAQRHRGLEIAEAPLDPKKLNGFVEVMRDGIPAEKADWFIGYENYEWRGAYITGDSISTSRRDKPYAYLKPGDVMAVAAVEYQLGKVYMKLISPEVYIAAGEKGRHPSRVTTMLSLDINDQTLPVIRKWVRPTNAVRSGDSEIVGSRNLQLAQSSIPNPQSISSPMPQIGARSLDPPSGMPPMEAQNKPQKAEKRILVEGMSLDEVRGIAGSPLNIVEEKYKTVYQYPGFDVIFRYGQMKDVAFKK